MKRIAYSLLIVFLGISGSTYTQKSSWSSDNPAISPENIIAMAEWKVAEHEQLADVFPLIRYIPLLAQSPKHTFPWDKNHYSRAIVVQFKPFNHIDWFAIMIGCANENCNEETCYQTMLVGLTGEYVTIEHGWRYDAGDWYETRTCIEVARQHNCYDVCDYNDYKLDLCTYSTAQAKLGVQITNFATPCARRPGSDEIKRIARRFAECYNKLCCLGEYTYNEIINVRNRYASMR